MTKKSAALANAAWHDFCDELKRAGDVVLRDTAPQDDLTLAEGYRHLVRMVFIRQ
jgi:hypothetical protein